MNEESGRGIGAKHAIRQALADALLRAATDLEDADLEKNRRQYNARVEWPDLYTFENEEGPAALRAVAEEVSNIGLLAAQWYEDAADSLAGSAAAAKRDPETRDTGHAMQGESDAFRAAAEMLRAGGPPEEPREE